MIDLHAHILPGLDDGAQNMDEAVEMGSQAAADGIHTLAATPHCRNGIFQNDEAKILPALDRLQEALVEKGIGLKLLPGVDIAIDPEVNSFFDRNPRLLLGGRYALLELPTQSIPPFTREFFFRMRLKGRTPIITHPERNSMIQAGPEILEDFVHEGAVVQVTAMSLTGEFGGEARECAIRLLKLGWVHFIASDAHSPRRRSPHLSKARKVLEEMIGADQAKMMVEEIPGKILRGEPVEAPPRPSSFPRSNLFRRLFGRNLNHREHQET